MDNAKTIATIIPKQWEFRLHLRRRGNIEINDAELLPMPVVDENHVSVSVCDLVRVATDRDSVVLPAPHLHVHLSRGDNVLDEVPLADDDADGDKGGVDDNTVHLLASACVLVMFLFWRTPVKNERAIPFVN